MGRWCGLKVQVVMVMRHLHNVVVVTCRGHLLPILTYVALRSHGNSPGNCPRELLVLTFDIGEDRCRATGPGRIGVGGLAPLSFHQMGEKADLVERSGRWSQLGPDSLA